MASKQLTRDRLSNGQEGASHAVDSHASRPDRSAVGVEGELKPGRARAAQRTVGNEGVARAVQEQQPAEAQQAAPALGGAAPAGEAGGEGSAGDGQAVGAYAQAAPAAGPASGGDDASGGPNGERGVGRFALRGVIPLLGEHAIAFSVGNGGMEAEGPGREEGPAQGRGSRRGRGGRSAAGDGAREDGGSRLDARVEVGIAAGIDLSLELNLGGRGKRRRPEGQGRRRRRGGTEAAEGEGDVAAKSDGTAQDAEAAGTASATPDVDVADAVGAVDAGGAEGIAEVKPATDPALAAEPATVPEGASGTETTDAFAVQPPARVGTSGGGGRRDVPALDTRNGPSGVADSVRGMAPSRRARAWAQLDVAFGAAVELQLDGVDGAGISIEAEIGTQKGAGRKGRGGGKRPKAPRARPGAEVQEKPAPTAPRPERTPPSRGRGVSVNVRGDASITDPVQQEKENQRARGELDAISTRPDVSTSAGRRPRVPRTGGADGARVGQAGQVARGDVDRARQEGRTGIEGSRGPEIIQDVSLHVEGAIGSVSRDPTGELAAVEGMEVFLDLDLSVDIEAAFDAEAGPGMEGAFEKAQGTIDAAEDQKDAGVESAKEHARTQTKAIEEKSRADQGAALQTARDDISAARADTLAKHDAEMNRLHAEVGARQQAEINRIDAHVAKEETKIDRAYVKAERDANEEVRKGEREAADAKKREQEKSKKKSWWQRACDVVANAVKAVSKAIGKVFDAVRSAVHAILDAVKTLASELIDAACKWVTSAIQAFAKTLQAYVSATIGRVFPALAEKLNGLIDAAADAATAFVEKVAEQGKAAINALCDTVEGMVNAAVDVFQGAVEVGLAVLQATVTGDWTSVLLTAFTAACRVAGIPEEQFRGLYAKAEETLHTILKDPGAFISNVIAAVGQGFQQFGANILTHLKNGFFAWLTGAAASAGIPTLKSLGMRDIFVFVLELLGITRESMRAKLSERIGEKNTARVDRIFSAAWAMFENGWDGLFEYVKDSLTGLFERAFAKLQEWIAQKVVQAAVTKIATMFTPVGAIVQAVMTAWDVYQFLRTQIQRIMGVVSAFVDSVSAIASGAIGPAANRIEGALAGAVPVAIDLLARLLNLDDITKKIRGFIEEIRGQVSAAIDKGLDRIIAFFSSKETTAEEPPAVQADVDPDGAPKDRGSSATGTSRARRKDDVVGAPILPGPNRQGADQDGGRRRGRRNRGASGGGGVSVGLDGMQARQPDAVDFGPEAVAPKDYPEPSNDTVAGGGTGVTGGGATLGPGARAVAPEPGLRKEDEGGSVSYHPVAGETFVAGDGDAQDVDPNDVRQGQLGDCYLMGGMAAVARANPDYIRKLIVDNKDGTYDVTLYVPERPGDRKGKPVTVTVSGSFPSNDGGRSTRYARSADTGPKGSELWPLLIEKAWAIHKGTYTNIEGGNVNDDGKFQGAISLLTNLREGYYVPENQSDRQTAEMIHAALERKMPVACDSKDLASEDEALKKAADAAGVVGNHAYAPVRVDLTAMTIDLQNPWGSHHVSGLKIADFKRFYRGVRIGQ
jgi:hypothetical protein